MTEKDPGPGETLQRFLLVLFPFLLLGLLLLLDWLFRGRS